MASLKKGKGYSGSSAKSRSVGEKDWQKCHMKLEACKAEGCTDHIADLIDHLQKLNGQPPPNVAQLRKMAKALRVPQKKDGVNVDGQTLLHNVEEAFLAEVESLPGGGVSTSSSSSAVGSPPAASAPDEFKSSAVGEEDWQKCHMKLEACKAEGCTDRITDLIDHLQKLNKEDPPNKSELRKIAKSLRVPQQKDGLTVDARTLFQNVLRAFLAEVESLPGGGVCQPAASAVQRMSSSGVASQPAASAPDEFKSPAVGEEDWQRCQMKLEACKAEKSTDRIADLIDYLQKLNKQQPPNQSELRKMAKALRVPQQKDGLTVNNRTLFQNIQRAFLAEVESLPGGVVQSADSAGQRASSSGVASQSAASAADEFESPAIRQILQDVLEFGRLPKRNSNPKSESAVAENKLAARVRMRNLQDRAKAMLDRFQAF